MPALSRALACAALLVLAGCGELPLAPESVVGTYVLTAVDGQPAPAVLATDAERTILLVADTIRFDADGGYAGRSCERSVDHVRDGATESCFDYSGVYRIRVRTLELMPTLVPGTQPLAGALQTGTLHGDRLTMSGSMSGSTRTYTRTAE